MSLYTEITKLPRDPIIGLTELFKNDKRATKYNLGVGIYLDEDGNIPILESVKKATQLLYEKKDPSVYLPMGGLDSFCEATKKLLFGPAHSSSANIMTSQALGGTGALRLGAELLQRTKKVPLVVISEPSWENHRTIFESAGFKVNTYPYYDPNTNCFLFEQFLTFLKRLPKYTVVILHANCHNPTGVDPSEEEWEVILDTIRKLDLIPFFDLAYLGFKENLKEDTFVLRTYIKFEKPFLVANSFSKNFSLYGERVGALSIFSCSQEESAKIQSHLKNIIRSLYSTPPTYGQKIVEQVLSNDKLYAIWQSEVQLMRSRITGMRKQLVKAFEEENLTSFSFIKDQHGMFSYSGLGINHAAQLRERFGIYILDSGRICIAALNKNNLKYVANAISTVVHKKTIQAKSFK
ncbi:MAG: amino acid aminotransferase [Burkholderiaceae bacterium]